MGKLRAMSLGELVWRLKGAAREKCAEVAYARRRTPAGPPRLAGGGPVPAPARVLFPGGEQARGLLEWFRRTRPAYVRRLADEADAICRHRFVLLGHRVDYGPEISWCADPRSGRPWPMDFHTRLRIFDGDTGSGDCKYVWELNRHQFLPTLAKAYRLTGERKYAEAAADMLTSWIAQNPFRVGVNWASGLEVAVRSLSWAWTYALLGDVDALDAETRRVVLGSLEQHGRYIEEHLSRYFSPYNHLVGELTALFVLGAMFRALKRAPDWERRGWQTLARILPEQFYEDGGSVEQSTSYHHFTLGFYVQAYLVRRASGGQIPEAVVRRLERAFEFALCLTRPDGALPMIGDADEARSVELGQSSIWDHRPHLAVGAVLFGRGDMKQVAGPFPDEGVWLLGLDGPKVYDALEAREPAAASRLLLHSGYAVMRTDWSPGAHYLNFDFGPLAAGVSERDVASAAHGHADALSIEVSAHGRPLLVDPGFLTYNGDPAWHRYFRETGAHNTVVVDERAQAEFRGRLRWSCAPRTELRRWVASQTVDVVEASHDGYRRLPEPVTHRRMVLFVKPDYWLVRDELIGTGRHQIDRYFHFAPGTAARNAGVASVEARGADGPGLAVVAVEPDLVTLDVLDGGRGPEDGWVAIGYDKRTRAPVIRWRTTAALPLVLHTLLVPFGDAPGEVGVDVRPREPGLGARALVVTIGGRRDVLLISGEGAAAAGAGDWTTDARVACVRTGRDGTVTACSLIDGSVVACLASPVLELDRPVRFAGLSRTERDALLELSDPAVVLSPSPEPFLAMLPTERRGDR